MKLSFLGFLEQAGITHGKTYSYDLGFFPAHLTQKIRVNCSTHGDFLQQIRRHLGGAGCPACARQRVADSKKLDRQTFLRMAVETHKNKFYYPEWEFAPGKNDKVPVICPAHGKFEQSMASHLSGAGCKRCENDRRKGAGGLTHAEFVRRASERHGQTYKYPTWDGLKQVASFVEVICPTHGGFEQKLSIHLRGSGCSVCGRNTASKKRALSFEGFNLKARKVHGDKYTYTPWEGRKQATDRYTARCSAHGEFSATISSHLDGKGCRRCGSKMAATKRSLGWGGFLKRARERHGERYTYPRQEYLSNARKITAICPVHGEFEQTAADHLSGHRCPSCVEQRKCERVMTFAEFLQAVDVKVGGRYSFRTPEAYRGLITLVELTCPEHGEFQQTGAALLKSNIPCPECRYTDMRRSHLDIAAQLDAQHPNRDWEFKGRDADDQLTFHCDGVDSAGRPHGEFKTGLSNFNRGVGCPKCSRKRSSAEADLRDFIQSLGLHTVKGSSATVPGLGRYQLDIVVPEKMIAVEYNGLIWHSERFKKEKRYHLDKTELAEFLGYRLIHVFEDEWLDRRELVEHRLKAILGVGVLKIHARKVKVEAITPKLAAEFLKNHHLQGAGPATKRSYGLFHEERLVAVATFGKSRYTKDAWELFRFVASARIVGGASKLLAAFKRDAQPTGTLVSYADRRWSDGGLYKALGFEFSGNTDPNYFYINNRAERFSRERFQKHKLKDMLKKFDKSLSEVVNCHNNGLYRIFDCGSSRWKLQL